MQSSESRRLRGVGAVLLIVGILVVIMNVMSYQAMQRLQLLFLLAAIGLPICGIFMLVTGKSPFGR